MTIHEASTIRSFRLKQNQNFYQTRIDLSTDTVYLVEIDVDADFEEKELLAFSSSMTVTEIESNKVIGRCHYGNNECWVFTSENDDHTIMGPSVNLVEGHLDLEVLVCKWYLENRYVSA